MNRVFLSLGGNTGDVSHTFELAVDYLLDNYAIQLIHISSLYHSEPKYDEAQDWFWNKVAEIETSLQPAALLQALQTTEKYFGRKREKARRFGPRTLDIDILFYNDLIIQTEQLTIPHPRFAERKFVLLPMSEISLNYVVPGTDETIRNYLDRCPDLSKVEKIL